ncbi:MAG: alpha/beta hydrolase [Myxococcaceae bacterium]|nr:alpha/beta hydrolase [Myxococcaceae bacterium]
MRKSLLFVPSCLCLACATPARLTAEQMTSSPPKRLAVASLEPRTVLTVSGVELALHDGDPSGAKPPIMCLHAIGHGGRDFAAFERAFGADYRIITLDWPGQGASGPDPKPAEPQRYLELLEGVVDALQLRDVVVLGNSIGGSVAIRYAASHPKNVRAVLLTDSAGLDANPGGFFPGLVIGHYERKMHAGVEGDPGFKDWFRAWYQEVLVTEEARAQRDAIVDSAYEIAPVLEQAWASFARADSDVRPLARKLSMPVFVGWAKNDGVVRWSRSREAVEQIPNVQVHLYDAGHAAFLETPKPFNDDVRRFLLELKAPAQGR